MMTIMVEEMGAHLHSDSATDPIVYCNCFVSYVSMVEVFIFYLWGIRSHLKAQSVISHTRSCNDYPGATQIHVPLSMLI